MVSSAFLPRCRALQVFSKILDQSDWRASEELASDVKALEDLHRDCMEKAEGKTAGDSEGEGEAWRVEFPRGGIQAVGRRNPGGGNVHGRNGDTRGGFDFADDVSQGGDYYDIRTG